MRAYAHEGRTPHRGMDGDDRFYLLGLDTRLQVTRLLRAWSRRNLIEQVFRILKHLLATEACQVRSEQAYYGHLVLRLMASLKVSQKC